MGNPVLLRALVTLVCAAFAFVVGLLCIRLVRRTITEEAEGGGEPTRSMDAMPLHVYNTVIQQLKQQKQELQVQSQAEQQRARTNETLSQAVLANLPSGVLVFGANGLVTSANPAARSILGFAAPAGMSVEDIFRGAMSRSGQPEAESEDLSVPGYLTDEIHAVLREGGQQRQIEVEYETPANGERFISVTISPVPSPEGGLLGVACLIGDQSELEHVRREQVLRGEVSAEIAQQLRTALHRISACAHQLATSTDARMAERLVKDIENEAAQLDQSVGGFLSNENTSQPVETQVAGD